MPTNETIYPTGIDALHAFLRRGLPLEENPLKFSKAYVRNIGYNLQYLEYLSHVIDKHLAENNLHVTVSTLTFKTFVITGMGIVEAILWYLLKKHGEQKTSEWEETAKLNTPHFQNAGDTYRIENVIYKKVDKSDQEMSLDSMIKKVEAKKLLGVDGQVYKDLNFLRKLRNRVHIHAVQHDKDTDWWNFSIKEVNLMKGILNSIFRSPLFKPDAEHEVLLVYLKVADAPEKLANDIPS